MPREPYRYSETLPNRRHGPVGYLNPRKFKPWLRDEFSFRCGYCLIRERLTHGGWRDFEVEHRIPRSIDPALESDYSNLVYACGLCNHRKHKHILPDPLIVDYSKQVIFNEDGTVSDIPTGQHGKYIIKILKLNDPDLVDERRRTIRAIRRIEEITAEMSSAEADNQFVDCLGFPRHLPWLRRTKVPQNTRPQGIDESYYEQKKRGELPILY